MGYHFNVDLPAADRAEARRVGEGPLGTKVGAYGSQDFLAGVLLGGYASGRFCESDRIRGSWVRPMPGIRAVVGQRAALPGDAGEVSTDCRTRSGFAAWLAYDHDGCTWLDVDDDAAQLGRKFKDIACPTLRSLMTWVDRRNEFGHPGTGTLDVDHTVDLCAAIEAVAAFTEPSPWHQVVREVGEVLHTATRLQAGVCWG